MARPLLSRLAWRRSLREGSRRWLIVQGWQRGLKGSRTWLLIGMGASTVHVVHRLLREPEARSTLELGRGDAIEIRTVDPPTR